MQVGKGLKLENSTKHQMRHQQDTAAPGPIVKAKSTRVLQGGDDDSDDYDDMPVIPPTANSPPPPPLPPPRHDQLKVWWI